MMRVTVDRPRVRGGQVLFSWQQSGPNPFQRRNRWSIDYHGVPLRRVHRAVLWEVLLSLQLPVWARLADEVEVVLPEPVPRIVLEWWRAYHNADGVRFAGPLTDVTQYTPYVPRPWRRPGPQVAVTYGGGKDSTLALHALLEERQPSQVLLLHLVQLFNGQPAHRKVLTSRSRQTVLGPARELSGVPTQLVTVDFLATLTKVPGAPRPHVNLYFAAMLPALLHHGVRQVTVSRTAVGYRVDHDAHGTPRWRNPSGRPERLQALQQYYRRVLGIDLAPESTHYAIGEFVSYGSLLRLYPQAFDRIVMCMRTERRGRWCQNCAKCLEFALFGLALGHLADDLDYDALLLSDHVDGLVQATEAVAGSTQWHGNAPYVRQAGTDSHFSAFCHALHLLDPEHPGLRVSEVARERLRLLKGTWGRVGFPAVASMDAAAVQAAGPLGQEVAAVASRAFPIVERAGQDHLVVGDVRTGFAHGMSMELPRLQAWARKWLGGPLDTAGPDRPRGGT